MSNLRRSRQASPISGRKLISNGALASVLLVVLAMSAMNCRAEPGAVHRGHQPLLAGINIAGAEFGQAIPGKFGTDYIYPNRQQIARFRELGFRIIRLPFRWERLQPDIDGPFDTAEWRRLDAVVQATVELDLQIVLDVHNYARRKVRRDGFSREHLIGTREVPTSAFETFWQELATRYRSNEHVVFGMMNEPHDISPRAWATIAQATINSIRATGARNLVLVPGTAWSGAHSWISSGNTILSGLRDPDENWAIEVHQYLDNDSSGRSPQVVSKTIGGERLRGFQAWALGHGLRAFLGEFGSGGDPASLAAITNLLSEVEANPKVWIGWCAWAAGPWWPKDDPFALEPRSDGTLPPQLRLLSKIAQRSVYRAKMPK